MPNVSDLIKTIQDIMRKDAGVDGDAQRLAQLGWMFFLKIFDDREKEMEVLRDNYKSPLPKELRWSNWAILDRGFGAETFRPNGASQASPGQRPGSRYHKQNQALKGRPIQCRNPLPASTSTSS